jgi:Ca2+-binding EF-hand superfamily protein
MPGADPNEDADKVFRALDRNSDGFLQPSEFTAKLREERLGIDPKLTGKLTKEEYRSYFHSRVSTGIEATIARREAEKAAEKAAVEKAQVEKAARKGQPVKAATPRLPDWFAELDTNMDGQIALREWRKSGRSLAQFMAMDLDGDGLLTKTEYFKYIRLKAKSDEEPPPADNEVRR